MSNVIRFAAPDPGTLKNSAILIVIVLIPGLIASAVGGITASVPVGLCSGAAMSFGTLMRPRTAALTTLLLGGGRRPRAHSRKAMCGSPDWRWEWRSCSPRRPTRTQPGC